MTQALNYSTRYINRNYRIKVAGLNEQGERSMDDACPCKLRRGLKITFYNK